MFKTSFVILNLLTLSYANLFTISDRNGNVLLKKDIQRTQNACLNQNATEYSLQAIYDELHRV